MDKLNNDQIIALTAIVVGVLGLIITSIINIKLADKDKQENIRGMFSKWRRTISLAIFTFTPFVFFGVVVSKYGSGSLELELFIFGFLLILIIALAITSAHLFVLFNEVNKMNINMLKHITETMKNINKDE